MSENAMGTRLQRTRCERAVNAMGILMEFDREGLAPRREPGLRFIWIEHTQTEEGA